MQGGGKSMIQIRAPKIAYTRKHRELVHHILPVWTRYVCAASLGLATSDRLSCSNWDKSVGSDGVCVVVTSLLSFKRRARFHMARKTRTNTMACCWLMYDTACRILRSPPLPHSATEELTVLRFRECAQYVLRKHAGEHRV